MFKPTQLGKPLKIIIVAAMAATLTSLALIAYLSTSDNDRINSVASYFTGDTESEITVIEAIPFSQKEVNDDGLAEGSSEIRQKGVNGEKKIVFKVTKDKDGNEISRTLVGEETVKSPIDEVIAIGTKKEVANSSSGSNNMGRNNTSGGGSASGSSGSKQNSGAGSSNNNSGNNNGSSGNGNGNNNDWVKAEIPLLYNICESKVKSRYGKGLYKRGGVGDDSAGHLRPSGYIMLGDSPSAGFHLVECIFETGYFEPMTATGLTPYIKTNSVELQEWSYTYTAEQIANINY